MAPVHQINSYSMASSASSSSKTSSKTGQNCGFRKGSSEHWDTSLPFASKQISSFDDAFFENARKRFLDEFRSCLADWDDAEDIDDTWVQRETSLSKRLTPQTESSSYTKVKDNKFAAVVRENGDCEVMMNICELKLKDVKVRITGEKFVVVEGSKDEGNTIRNCRQSPRNFLYQFSLPENVSWDAVYATLSCDGILTITMPPKVNTEKPSDICGMETHRDKRTNIIGNINDNNGQKCRVIEIQNAHSSLRTTGNSSDISCQTLLESATGQDQLMTSKKGDLQILKKLKDCSILEKSREEESLEKKKEYLEKDCSFITNCNQSKAYLSQSPLKEKRQVKETIIPIRVEVWKDDHTTNSSESKIKTSNVSSGTKKVSFHDDDSIYLQRYTNGNTTPRRMGESISNCTESQHKTFTSETSNKKDIDQRTDTLQHCTLGHRNDLQDLTIKTQAECCDAKYNELLPNLSSITRSTHLNTIQYTEKEMQSEQESSALTGKQCFIPENVCKETEEKTNSNAKNLTTETSHQSPKMEIKHFPLDDTAQSSKSEPSVQLEVVQKGRFLEESTFLSMTQSVTSALEEILSKNSKLPVHGDLLTCYRRYQEDNAKECNVLTLTQAEQSSLKFIVDVFGLMEQSITVSIVNGKAIRINGQHSHMKETHQNTKDFSKTLFLQEGSSIESASASISSDGFLMITINKKSCPESIANEPCNEDSKYKEKISAIRNVNILPQENQEQSSFGVMSAGSGNRWTSKASLDISEDQHKDVKRKTSAQAEMVHTATLPEGESGAYLSYSKHKPITVWKEEPQAKRDEGSNEAVLDNKSEDDTYKCFTNSKDNQSCVQKNESQAIRDFVFIEAAVNEESEAYRNIWCPNSKDKLESVSNEESVANRDGGFIKAAIAEESETNTDTVITNSKDKLESAWKHELEAKEGPFTSVLENESAANRCKCFTNSKCDHSSLQKEEPKANRDVVFIEAAIKEESEANTGIEFINSKDKFDSLSKEESEADRDATSTKAILDTESEANTDIVFTNSKDKVQSVWKEESEVSTYEGSIKPVLENELETNRHKCFINSEYNQFYVQNNELQDNRDVKFIETAIKEESEANTDIRFTNSKDKLKSVWKDESEANTDTGFTDFEYKHETVSKEESENSRDVGFNKAVIDEESETRGDVGSTKADRDEESEANTDIVTTNSKDKLESVCKEESKANRDVGFIKAVIDGESKAKTDIVITNSKEKLESVCKEESEVNRSVEFTEAALKEESDASTDLRLINSKDKFYSVCTEESDAGIDIAFNNNKNYSVRKEELLDCKISSVKENSIQIQKEISTNEQIKQGYLHPQPQNNDISPNVTIEEVSDDYDTNILEMSSTLLKKPINQQEMETTSTLTDQTNEFLSNNKCKSLAVVKKGFFDVDTFYKNARFHFHKREKDPIHKENFTSVNGDVNDKTIICLLEDQDEVETDISFQDDYTYMIILDVSSYLQNVIEVEVLNDDKVLVKCSSMNNDGELDHQKDFSKTFDIPTGLEIGSGVCGVSRDGIFAVAFNKKVSLDAQQVKSSGDICITDNSEKDQESYNVEEKVKLTWEGVSNPINFTGRNLTLSNQDEKINISSGIQALTDQIVTTTNGLTREQNSLSRDHNKFMEVSCSSDDAHQHYEMVGGRGGKESVKLTSFDSRNYETHDHLDRSTDSDANENAKMMKQKKNGMSFLENDILLGICESQSKLKPVLPAVENGTMQIPCTNNCISIQVEEKLLFSEDAFFDRARPHFAWPIRELMSKGEHFSSKNEAHTDDENHCPMAECNEGRISTFAQDEQYYMIILDVGIYTKKTNIDIKVLEEKEVVIEWASLTSEQDQHLKIFSKRFHLPCGIDVESGFSGISSDGILIITFPKMNQPSGVERSLSQEEILNGSTLIQTLTRDTNLTQSEGFIITSEGGRNCISVSDVARWEESSEATGASTLETYYANVRLLPFTKRGLFFHDSFFHEVHTLFQTAMNKVLMSCTNDHNCKNASDIETYHCLRDQNPNFENQAFHAQEDHHSYKVVLDVANLSEESIVVYVVDKKQLVIEGQVEKTDTSSSSLQSFKRAFSLPQTTDFIEATATLSSDGVLFVDFSKRIGVQRD
ncbi:serine-rich adhesin for platelets-like [Palaemon carinicauda]|uniref:serine-rich adhesin for platelets-like n=1 Tax=Palaemon carinicauda TaxID=392227 RepID=UPI0035B6572B